MEIPSITYSNFFGPVSKVRWYNVTNFFSEYNVELNIQTNQTYGSEVRIENRANTNGFEWSERIDANVTQENLYRLVKVLHVPILKATEYVVINQVV